ncbi:YciI family protein [Cypionkella sp. TWP1-2-1b2]|uniref:YciI family protein n=1 Tax=Cypionkella sp. TWP1-2-1b2 TaxID=2804675 RepID=UPI003CF17FF1
MRVMVIVKSTADSELGLMPSPAAWAAMEAFNDSLEAAGITRAMGGLKPSSLGKRIRFDGSGRMITDGPFAATNEVIAGFWIWEVKDIAEAVDWVTRCPNPMPGPSEIEIRPFYEDADVLIPS